MSDYVNTLTEDKKRTFTLKAITYIVSILLAILILTPFWGMLKEVFGEETIIELKPGGNISVTHVPREGLMTFKEFCELFNEYTFIGFGNSVYVTVTSTILNIYISALTAYAITAYEWKMREAFEKLVIVAMMIPGTVASVGLVQWIYKLGLTNKLFVFILLAIASPMNVFFMRMYLKATFSKELVESARLDGAGEFRIFNQIIFPIMKPAIATQTIFTFVASWSNVWIPRIVLIEGKKRLLPIMGGPPGAELLICLPPILLYAFLSKHIVEGISLGSVKM